MIETILILPALIWLYISLFALRRGRMESHVARLNTIQRCENCSQWKELASPFNKLSRITHESHAAIKKLRCENEIYKQKLAELALEVQPLVVSNAVAQEWKSFNINSTKTTPSNVIDFEVYRKTRQ